MSTGFFLGGVAEGAQAARLADQRDRELDIKEMTIEQAMQRAAAGEIDSRISETVKATTDIITQAKKAGASSDQIKALIAPMQQDIAAFAKRSGRDAGAIFRQFDAMIGVPAAPEAADSPSTEIGKLRQDLQRGFITQPEFDARVNNLTRTLGEPNIVEGIRRKIATGETLTAGEKQVYDDALKADPIARLLAGAAAANPTLARPPAAPSSTPAPTPKRPDPMGMR